MRELQNGEPAESLQGGVASLAAGAAAAIFGRHGRNALWSVSEYVALPLLLLAATPFLLRALGEQQFGLWMLATAIASLGPVAGLGMAPAAMRWVATHLAREERPRAVAVVRTGLSAALVAGLAIAAALAAGGQTLATLAFSRMGDPAAVTVAVGFGGAMILAQQVDVVFSAALKGAEQFRLAAPVEVANKFALVGAGLATALSTQSLVAVLSVNLAVTALGAVAKGVAAARVFGPEVCLPGWSSTTFREIRTFAVWNWVQGLAGALFASIDRLLVGAFLGAGPLAAYSICLQLAQQVHALPAAAMSVLLPLASRQSADPDDARFARLRRASIVLNVAIVAVLAGLLAIAGRWILTVWMGSSFATANLTVFLWLVAAHVLLALNIAPHYLLLGRGNAALVSASNLGGGILGAACAVLLVPAFGLVGAAASRILYGPAIMVNYLGLFRLKARR